VETICTLTTLVPYPPIVRLQPRFALPALAAILGIGIVVAIVLVHSLNRSSSSSVASTAPHSDFDGAAFPPGVHAHGFTLTNQRGRSVSLSSYSGKVVALAFLSSDCRTCMLLAQQVRGALDELSPTRPAPGVRTIFVSTDPRADTPARVSRFLGEASLTGRVEYLSGAPARLQPVWHAYAVVPASAGRKASEAAAAVLLIDREGIKRVGFGLEQITPEGLTHDILLLLGKQVPHP
jgi:protein SCO1